MDDMETRKTRKCGFLGHFYEVFLNVIHRNNEEALKVYAD